MFQTQDEEDAERHENHLREKNAHYVDLYVQLKRNVDIKTKILGQEQNVCEIGYTSPSTTKNDAVGQNDETSSILVINFKTKKEKLVRLLQEFKTCKELHRTLLTQN